MHFNHDFWLITKKDFDSVFLPLAYHLPELK